MLTVSFTFSTFIITLVQRPGMCPTADDDVVGTCVEECEHDHECGGRSKCCSNGCGHVCVEAVAGKLYQM